MKLYQLFDSKDERFIATTTCKDSALLMLMLKSNECRDKNRYIIMETVRGHKND